MTEWDALLRQLQARYGTDDLRRPDDLPEEPPAVWQGMARHASVRAFEAEPPSLETLRLLAALAFSAPSKSDLQQRDIVVVREVRQLSRLKALLDEQSWVAGSPVLLVFCGNNRRQRQLHELRGHAFANDHFDAFFNAAVDAAVALAAFVTAAEAIGLGTCPISAIRNRAEEVSRLLTLPDHVFPLAGLAVGYPKERPQESMRLPLSVTLHEERFSEDGVLEAIAGYDRRRAAAQPYAAQRHPERFGEAADYGWSEDKARQYALPERADFGAFIRGKGFKLD